MLKKLNITLGIIALCGALFAGGVWIYANHTEIENSKIIQQIGG